MCAAGARRQGLPVDTGDVLDLLGPLHGRRLLEVGCRAGTNLLGALIRGAIVWGVDPAAPLLIEARRRLPGADLRVGRVDELPFDSGSFDVVCSFDPIAGALAAADAIGEMARVCREGGLVVVTLACAPTANPDHEKGRTVILMR